MTEPVTEPVTELVTEPVTELEAAALAAKPHAYAPYSKFHVGAAVRVGGEVFTGVNVESASYPLSVCAERNAIAAAIRAGQHHLEEVAVATDASPPAAPCGGCRQVLREFAANPDQVRITAVNPQGERRSWTLGGLLPDSFTGAELP
ncbi:MAG: cytidine deaminase [Kofleriaceae bacterium]